MERERQTQQAPEAKIRVLPARIPPRSLLMAAATKELSPGDSTTTEPTVNFSQARFAFRRLEAWLTSDEANRTSEADIEEQIEQRGREVLRLLLQAHLRQR